MRPIFLVIIDQPFKILVFVISKIVSHDLDYAQNCSLIELISEIFELSKVGEIIATRKDFTDPMFLLDEAIEPEVAT